MATALWARATLAAALLPGIVAGVIPAGSSAARPALPCPSAPSTGSVLELALAGLGVLLVTIVAFATRGHGTLAHTGRPHHAGPRRPLPPHPESMYLGALGLLLGQALWWASGGVLLYAGAVAVAFSAGDHLRGAGAGLAVRGRRTRRTGRGCRAGCRGTGEMPHTELARRSRGERFRGSPRYWGEGPHRRQLTEDSCRARPGRSARSGPCSWCSPPSS